MLILPINTFGVPQPSSIDVQAIESTSFVSKWNTTLTSDVSSSSTQIALPLVSSGTYDFLVDWGDGNSDIITSYNQVETNHTYSSEGEYTLVITGTLYGWQFNIRGDRLKIIEITQWGNIRLGNGGSYFSGCINLVLTATDAPDLTGTTTLYRAFAYCYHIGGTGNMDFWDVSSVTDMSLMFYGAESFNQPLDSWDVSSVTDMSSMFSAASSFNQPIGNWDVSRVTQMDYMFFEATSFNQPLENWDVSNVINMNYMFGGIELSTQNYDALLNAWSKLPLQTHVIFDAGNSHYTSEASDSRSKLIDEYQWTIHDGGKVDSTTTSNFLDIFDKPTPATQIITTEEAFLPINNLVIIISLGVFAVFNWMRRRKKKA
jgi:surface protein